jgi:hypothetical protein
VHDDVVLVDHELLFVGEVIVVEDDHEKAERESGNW